MKTSPTGPVDVLERYAVRLMPNATLLALLTALVTAGCEPTPPAADAPRAPNSSEQTSGDDVFPDDENLPARSTVELTSATGVLDDEGIVRFTIGYRFTAGRPRGYYTLDIAFPGTESNGIKPMEAGELQKEGTIITGIEVGDAPVDVFEITMSETDSPDQGFTLISEKLQGHVQRPGDPAPSTPEAETSAN